MKGKINNHNQSNLTKFLNTISIGKTTYIISFALLLMTANFTAQGQTVDSFNPNVRAQSQTPNDAAVTSIAFQPDGRVLIGGLFYSVGGVYRPNLTSEANWYLLRSTAGFAAVQFGISTDKPVAGDYDGDGKTDEAFYRPSNGVWYLLRSRDGFTAVQFGISTDLPTPADYDGDGKTDEAVFRDGTLYQMKSTQGFAAAQFSAINDKPIPAAFIP